MGKKKSTEQFIHESKAIHGNKYDYSRVCYVNAYTKVIITCPVHGDFQQAPQEHLKGSGCRRCGYNKLSNTYKHTTEQFIDKAKKIHGERYDYSKVMYYNDDSKLTITCPVHGDFIQKANNHLNGQGCPECYKDSFYTRDNFIEKSRNIHGERYDYSKVDYINITEKVIIGCHEHGDFRQQPYSHVNGAGCPKCADERRGFWNPDYIRKYLPDRLEEPCTLYVIECYSDGESFVKVGITSKTLEERYKDKKDFVYQYSTLYEYQSTLIECSKIEQDILRQFNEYQYEPNNKFAGSSECIDINQKGNILKSKYK